MVSNSFLTMWVLFILQFENRPQQFSFIGRAKRFKKYSPVVGMEDAPGSSRLIRLRENVKMITDLRKWPPRVLEGPTFVLRLVGSCPAAAESLRLERRERLLSTAEFVFIKVQLVAPSIF